MNEELLSKENLSTIFVWLWVIVGPYLSAYLSQDQFVTLGIIIIGIAGAVYSSKNPNTRWSNNNSTTEESETTTGDCEDDGC